MRSSTSSSSSASDNYGQIDGLGTQLFIPSTRRFDLCSNEVDGQKNIRIPMVGGAAIFVDHPGGIVFFLRETVEGPDVEHDGHFASVFAAPSIVTLSQYDAHHLGIDCTNVGTSACWPGYEALSSCPVCRTKAIPDTTAQKQYVLALQSMIMRAKDGINMSFKLLPRLFCTACFGGITGPVTVQDAAGNDHHMCPLEFIRTGMGAPFEPEVPADRPCPAYNRTNRLSMSGLESCINRSIGQYFMNMMGGGKTVRSNTCNSGIGTRFNMSKLIKKSEDTCQGPGCSRTAFDVFKDKNAAKDRLRSLMKCSRCRVAQYCSPECQKSHWKEGHKNECVPVECNTSS